MTISLDVLDDLCVASPCPMKWDRLKPVETGDSSARVRFCERCELKVYNIANMTSSEAAEFLARHTESGERLCAALRRRADGTVITRDCPVGRAKIRARLVGVASRAAAAVLLVGSMGMAFAARAETWQPRTRTLSPFSKASVWLEVQAIRLGVHSSSRGYIMGSIMIQRRTPPNVPSRSPVYIRNEYGL